jgi:hypothetical protein
MARSSDPLLVVVGIEDVVVVFEVLGVRCGMAKAVGFWAIEVVESGGAEALTTSVHSRDFIATVTLIW